MVHALLLCLFGLAAQGAPRFSLAPVSAAERHRTADLRLPLIGIHRAVGRPAIPAGTWEGSRWRLALESPGAAAVRVHFTNFAAGSGRVWLQGSATQYTGAGPFGDGDFWSETVFGEEAEIVYEAPADAPPPAVPPFEIAELAHRFAGDPAAAGACELDVTCYTEWAESARSVALIVLELPEGEAACSGALLRTSSGSGLPFLLTADHCVNSAATARTVEAFWAYQSTVCRAAPPDLTAVPRSPVGAQYLVSRPQPQGDFSLLLLAGVPSGVAFAAWDPIDLDMNASVVGIHHPMGSFKRISFGERYANYWEADYTDVPDAFYFPVRWQQGIVEPGSSGSPLFSRPGVIAGMLSYGFIFSGMESCEVNPSIAGYGRFSAAYGFLRPYLEDQPPDPLALAPSAITFQVTNGAVTPASPHTLVISTTSASPVTFAVGADAPWILLSAGAGTVAAGAPATVEVRVRDDLARVAGVYTGVVKVTAPEISLTTAVRADVTVTPSVVSATVNPSPVEASPPDADGCRWFFRLALRETAGVATRLTLLRINGADYTGSIADWFGGALLPASGVLQVDLRSRNLPVPFDTLFEFAGKDEGTGRVWRRSVSVPFR